MRPTGHIVSVLLKRFCPQGSGQDTVTRTAARQVLSVAPSPGHNLVITRSTRAFRLLVNGRLVPLKTTSVIIRAAVKVGSSKGSPHSKSQSLHRVTLTPPGRFCPVLRFPAAGAWGRAGPTLERIFLRGRGEGRCFLNHNCLLQT